MVQAANALAGRAADVVRAVVPVLLLPLLQLLQVGLMLRQAPCATSSAVLLCFLRVLAENRVSARSVRSALRSCVRCRAMVRAEGQ